MMIVERPLRYYSQHRLPFIGLYMPRSAVSSRTSFLLICLCIFHFSLYFLYLTSPTCLDERY